MSTSRKPRQATFNCDTLESRRLLSSMTSELQAVISDFQAIARVATTPSRASVAALTSEVETVMSKGSLTKAEEGVLLTDADAVLVSANVPASLIARTNSDVETLLASLGTLSKSEIDAVGEEVLAYVADL